MPKVELDVETTASPEAVRAALLDFSDRRPEIWPGIDPSLYKVYSVGADTADVQEGSKMPGASIWAREHYDWSKDGLVTWTVKESNFCAPGSYVSAAIAPRGDGGSRIHVIWNRTPTSVPGRLATVLIQLTRGRPVATSMRKALARLERPPTS
ncbi:SRPBCC family protein [Terrabacter terrigena]|uniref:SRPBCC family protein n=1 Tax=Terrabacter terrigena TaxID=574718 RepID=A0ABW3N0B8_9MICO